MMGIKSQFSNKRDFLNHYPLSNHSIFLKKVFFVRIYYLIWF